MDENELQEQIKGLSRKQRICLGIQILLIALSIVFYQYAIMLLPAHFIVVMTFGGGLSNKATSLARKKYPDVPLRAGYIGKGAGWDPYIMEEAKRFNDDLTVKILKFNHWTVYCFLAAMAGNVFMWCLSAALVF